MKPIIWRTIVRGLFVFVFILKFFGCTCVPEPSAPGLYPEFSTEVKPAPESHPEPLTEVKPVPESHPEPLTEVKPVPESHPEPSSEVKSTSEVTPKICTFKELMPPRPKPRFYVHEVRWPGETLSVISLWYTGSLKNWKTINKANPDLNPKLMFIGYKILIPLDILKTSKPMPYKYLRASLRKKHTPFVPVAEPAKESDEIELFGPQDIDQASVESKDIELFEPVE